MDIDRAATDQASLHTVNIHTHLIGCVAYVAALIRTHHAILPLRIPPLRLGHAIPTSKMAHLGVAPGTGLERWKADCALSCFLASAVFCLGASAWFHAVQCKSKRVCEAAHRGDYVSLGDAGWHPWLMSRL